MAWTIARIGFAIVCSSGRLPLRPDETLTVAELVLRFMEHATAYYRDTDGRPTSSVADGFPRLAFYRGSTKGPDRFFGP